MEYKTKLSAMTPTLVLDEKIKKESPEFLFKLFEMLKDDIEGLKNHYKVTNLHKLDLGVEKIFALIKISHNWITFLYNTFNKTKCEKFKTERDLRDAIARDLVNFIRQVNENIIITINEFHTGNKGKYFQKYIENISDAIFKEIVNANEALLDIQKNFLTSPQFTEDFFELFKDLTQRVKNIHFFYQSFKDIISIKQKSTKLKELLNDFSLKNALNRLETAEDFFKNKIWDKAVGDMRFVLEMVVTYIARCILSNPNWKAPLKDGIEILRLKGIILDEVTANHFRAKNHGIHGIISIKGHHAEGITDDNLASSELEAKYFMSLTENVIEYLLTSFRESEFYESEESDS